MALGIGSVTYHRWLVPEGDPVIDAESLGWPQTRALLRQCGFHRVGAVRKRSDLGRFADDAGSESYFARLAAGRMVAEAWVDPDGLAIGLPTESRGTAELSFTTVLADGSVVLSYVLGREAFRALGPMLFPVPAVGAYTEAVEGVPGPEHWEAHRARVARLVAETGSPVVPLRTVEDALFADKLRLRASRMAGAEKAAEAFRPSLRGRNSGLYLIAAVMALLTLRTGSTGVGLLGIASLLPALLATGWISAWAARKTAPPRLDVAALRALPSKPAPDGAVGDWIG